MSVAATAKPVPKGSRIIHEIPGRLRLACPALRDPALDAAFLEAFLSAIPGVERVRLNLRGASVVVWHDGRPSVREGVVSCLESLPDEVYHDLPLRESRADGMDILGRGLVTLAAPFLPRPVAAVPTLAMTLPVLADGVASLLRGELGVDVLDGASVGFSLMRRDYFTANAIATLLGVGKYLENRSELRTTDLLKNLLRPRMDAVRVLREGAEVRVHPDEVGIGESVVCGSGDLIPVDGVVREGEASVNQSSLTGESLPVHAHPGSRVLSGSVVMEGRLVIQAEVVGSGTGMARLRRFLEHGLRSRSASQGKTDRLADRLVPVTLALGVGRYLLTHDARKAASVLTVDYSCAIKLATPVAVRMGMYASARNGVLIKGAEAMDALARVDVVLFDKTGTLTAGKLRLTDIEPLNGLSGTELLALAAGAEAHYEHPVARAVVEEARRRDLPLPSASQVDFIVAHGVSAIVEGERILAGSRHFLHDDEGVDCSGFDERAAGLRGEGKSLLYVARRGHLAGVIALRDEPRPESAAILDALKAAGIRETWMLTGDHRDTARAVAGKLGRLDQTRWELKPGDKAEIVRELQAQGRVVAFVGDGVNDAPALVLADVGICMSAGADLARESAGVILLHEDLRGLPVAFAAARNTRRVIRNCLAAAVGLNSMILVQAGMRWASPVLSALLHNTTTLGILAYAGMSGIRAGRVLGTGEKSGREGEATS